eukprot:TRINITY_DN5248_c0_g1_i1.p1 TRINITY_DN5248_c0_g1~~TRINITY_DN5248_c0_g1_i1.p1  ORF type:complete len:259 (-),score=79.56 TRINITY_DN5248_c0_g1_i1:127-903(-)
MKVVVVPILSDNFSYFLIDEANGVAAVVDPAEPTKVYEEAQKLKLKVTTILTTHHHWDHAGGNEQFFSLISDPNLVVVGGDDRIPALNKKVTGGDKFKVGSIEVKVLFTPCHTSGHVLYYVEHPNSSPVLFTGDTLFIGGCGRFFEGTPSQMFSALIEVVSALPKNTQIYCGHEYTIKNLQFALTLEPQNKALKDKLEWATNQRKNGHPTVPSLLEEELAFNPFMRVKERTVAEAVGLGEGGDPVEVMRLVRAKKDAF